MIRTGKRPTRSPASVHVSGVQAATQLDRENAASVKTLVPRRNMIWPFPSLRPKLPTLNVCHDVRCHILLWLDFPTIQSIQRVDHAWKNCVLDYQPDDECSAASFQVVKVKMMGLVHCNDPNASRRALQWVSYAGHMARRLQAKVDKIREMFGDEIEDAENKLNAMMRPAHYARREAFEGAIICYSDRSLDWLWLMKTHPTTLSPLLTRCFLLSLGALNDCSAEAPEPPERLWSELRQCLSRPNKHILDQPPRPEVLRWLTETYDSDPTLSPSVVRRGSAGYHLARFVEATVELQRTIERSEPLRRELHERKGAIDQYKSVADAYLKLGKEIVMANIRRRGESEVWWNALSGVADHWASRF